MVAASRRPVPHATRHCLHSPAPVPQASHASPVSASARSPVFSLVTRPAGRPIPQPSSCRRLLSVLGSQRSNRQVVRAVGRPDPGRGSAAAIRSAPRMVESLGSGTSWRTHTMSGLLLLAAPSRSTGNPGRLVTGPARKTRVRAEVLLVKTGQARHPHWGAGADSSQGAVVDHRFAGTQILNGRGGLAAA